MQIDIAVPGKGKHPLWNYAAISHDDDRIRVNVLQQRAKSGVILDLLRLLDSQTAALRRLLHGGSGELKSTSLGAIRLCDYERNCAACGDKSFQSGNRERGS